MNSYSPPHFFLLALAEQDLDLFVSSGFNIIHNGTLPNYSFHLLADALVLKECIDPRFNITNIRFLLIKLFLFSNSLRHFPYSESLDFLSLMLSLQIGLNLTDTL